MELKNNYYLFVLKYIQFIKDRITTKYENTIHNIEMLSVPCINTVGTVFCMCFSNNP